MKKYYKIIFSVTLAPVMSSLLIFLLYLTSSIMGPLILIHITTLFGVRLLARKDFLHSGALFAGYAILSFICCIYEFCNGAKPARYFVAFIGIALYTLPALAFINIDSYIEENRK